VRQLTAISRSHSGVRVIIAVVRTLQPIIHRGQIVAIVIAGQAIIDDTLQASEQTHVQAMCLYALEIADGARPGPYTDAGAEAYARRALLSR
jgi:hypothetical protein